jgi:hypothetical protein
MAGNRVMAEDGVKLGINHHGSSSRYGLSPMRLLIPFIDFSPGVETRKTQTTDVHTISRTINVSNGIKTTPPCFPQMEAI